MKSTSIIALGFSLVNAIDFEDSSYVRCEESSDSCYSKKSNLLSKKNKHMNFVTPFINCGLPVAHFSETRSYKFTELTYLTIKNLVLPKIDFFNPIVFNTKRFAKTNKNTDLEFEIYSLLLHVINTINPIAFDVYYKAFSCGKYQECFLILQRLYTSDSELERLISSNVLFLNRKARKGSVNAIHLVDIHNKDVFCIDLPSLNCGKRSPFYLPKQILKFEEMVLFSFDLDEAIMNDIEAICPLGLRSVYVHLLKSYYKSFNKLTPEGRILGFLRIKFFVFNSVGLTISFLSSSVKHNILDLLISTAKSQNDTFFRAYACSLGLLNK